MSSARATTTANSEGAASAGKAYISTAPFYTALFTYSTYLDSGFVKRGLLTVNQVANAGTTAQNNTLCPAGRVLALSGRKLTPGVNPQDYIITTYNGTQVATTPKFYIGVCDLVSGLNGFIDPTSTLFAQYDKNRPVTDYLTDMSAVNLGLTVGQSSLPSGQGAKVNMVTYNSQTYPFTQTPNLGSTVNVGAATAGKIQLAAAIASTSDASFLVQTTAVTANSIIMLSTTSGTATLTVTAIAGSGVFNIANTTGLEVGQFVTIGGTFTNGSVNGVTNYTTPQAFYIITIVTNTSFTLSTSYGGSAITTSAGTGAGGTFTLTDTVAAAVGTGPIVPGVSFLAIVSPYTATLAAPIVNFVIFN